MDKSLVVADVEEDGSIRYRLHETLRQYGQERLIAAHEAETTREQHFAYFRDLAERAYAHAGRIDPTPRWLDRQEREHANFRAALAWARDRPTGEFVQLAGALSSLWWLRAIHLPEGREWLASALASREGRTASVARAVTGASLLASWGGDPASAQRLGSEALALWRELGDETGVALALEALGWSHVMAGDDPSALRFMQESLEMLRSIGNERLLNRGILDVTQVLVNLGRVDEAESMSREALARGRDLEEPRDIHFALHFLADAALARGDVVEAEERYRQSLRATMDYGNTLQAGMEIQGMAMAIAGQGRLERALRLNAAAQAWLRDGGIESERIPFWAGYMIRYLAPARVSIGEAALGVVEDEGRRMGFEAALDQALDRTGD